MTTTEGTEYIVTRTTTDIFMVVADDAKAAGQAVTGGKGVLMQHNTSDSVRPRTSPPISNQNPQKEIPKIV